MQRVSKALINDMGRMFVQVGNCDKYTYQNCFGIGDISQSRDEPTVVERSNGRGGFVEADIIKGSLSRVSTELRAYDKSSSITQLESIFKDDCKVNLQIHYGSCVRPDIFNEFDKVVVLSNAYATDFSKSALLAMNSGEREPVISNLGISAKEFFTVVNATYSAEVLEIQGPIVSLTTQNAGSCPNCPCSASGRDIILALQLRDSICPEPSGIVADLWLLYSFDGGETFDSLQITDINISQEVEPILCEPFYFNESPNIRLDGSIFSIASANGQSIVYDLNHLFMYNELDIVSFSGRVGSFDYAVYDSVISKGYTYFVGQLGNAWRVNNIDGKAQQILLDLNATSDLYSIDCLDGNFIIGGKDGIWVGSGLNANYIDINIRDVRNVEINNNRYLAATADSIYLSCDCAELFQKKWTAPVGYCIKDLSFYNDDVGAIVLNNDTAGPIVYRTIDGGNSFFKADRVTLPNTYVFMEISASDINKFYAVGLNDVYGNVADVCYTDEEWIPASFTGIFLQSELK